MNAIVAGLYGALTAEASIISLLSSAGAVYDGVAPEDAVTPYIVIKKSDGRDRFNLGARSHKRHLYTVKAVTTSKADAIDASEAQAIDEAIDALLGFDGQITITGRTLMLCRRDRDMPDYEEITADEVFVHRGGIYQIWST